MEQNIEPMARGLAETFGLRALEVTATQFEAAEGEARIAWGRIMDWLTLQSTAELGGS